MVTRKPETKYIWIAAAVVIGLFIVVANWPESTHVESVKRVELNDAEASMSNVYREHVAKFPVTWKMKINEDTKSYEIEDRWFRFCEDNGLFMVGGTYKKGIEWIRSGNEDYSDLLKTGTGISYDLQGRYRENFITFTISIEDSPVE